jgi:hypothetical protein
MKRRHVAIWLVSSLMFFGCARPGDGLTKYPVSGKVLVNGKPEAGIVVRFEHKDTKLKGQNARHPVGITQADGMFQLSTNGEYDGAVAGVYAVTFIWPESKSSPAGDHFQGKFRNSETSKFTATVEPGPNLLPVFELNFEPAAKSETRPSRE